MQISLKFIYWPLGHKLSNEMIRFVPKKDSSDCKIKKGLRAQDWKQGNQVVGNYDRPVRDKTLIEPK